MKNKKGQVTLFVVAGLMLLLLIVLMISIRFYLISEEAGEQVQEKAQLPADIQNVEGFIRRCIRSVGSDGLLLLGKQGGYIAVPEIIKKDATVYWHLDKVNIQPTLNNTRNELEQFIVVELHKCLDFTTLEQELNVKIVASEPQVFVTFAQQRTNIVVRMPTKVTRQDFVTNFEEFAEDFKIPWRRMYELATQVNMRQLDAQFKFSSPTEFVQQQTFDVNYIIKDDSITYTVTDRTQLENGQHFSLTFASRLLNSNLRRLVTLQNNSRTVPTVFPYIIYSIDKKAQLYIFPGTTTNLLGKDVQNITIGQTYLKNITRPNVPMIETEENDVWTQNISWFLTYPVYQFEPTGLRFNSPQRLVLYWDEDRVPHKGNMGILYDEGEGWRPLPSAANYQEHYVYTDIPGFSRYTPVDCYYQPEKSIEVTSQLVPSSNCEANIAGKAGIIIVIVLLAVIVTIFTFGAAGAPAGLGVAAGIAAVTAAGSAAVSLVGLVAISVIISGAIVGGAYLNSQTTFSSLEDAIRFTPTCDQSIHVSEDTTGGSGMCIPEGDIVVIGPKYETKNNRTRLVKAGELQVIQAITKKCTGARRFFCQSCETTCTTRYR